MQYFCIAAHFRAIELLNYNISIYDVQEMRRINYLTSHALGNITDFGEKCRNCNTINRITLEDGELKKES